MTDPFSAAGVRERLAPLRAEAWRVVEAQHHVATHKLVDTADEQQVLEELIESAKPPRPVDAEFAQLHYLLATPFRYPPLRHGTRFGTRAERGIWYGSASEATALAEAAYYRLVFLAGTAADLPHVTSEHSTFAVDLAATRGLDLAAGPYLAQLPALTSPVSYAHTQPLGTIMRQVDIEAFRFRSARDPDEGDNFGVFAPTAFANAQPKRQRAWHCSATQERVLFHRRDLLHDEIRSFARRVFEVDGTVPMPPIDTP
ncbi:MAG: RES family NAD+ phosphorylase [Planctomycetota bacterium]